MIFASYLFDMKLTSRICKEFKKLNTKKPNNPSSQQKINIFSHQGNTNQNYIEMSPVPSQNGYHQENK
jgi:hypothetical protein